MAVCDLTIRLALVLNSDVLQLAPSTFDLMAMLQVDCRFELFSVVVFE